MADDPTIRWDLANRFGIQTDESQDAWHTGCVTDVLELDTGGLLVSSPTGGVWSIDTGGNTLPLSDSWPNPDVNCLAFGPDDPRHVFAGCARGVIRETDLGEALPLLAWREVAAPLPAHAGDVNGLVIIRNLRRLIAACDGGLFWTTLPPTTPRPGCLLPLGPPPARAPYVWRQAKVENVNGVRGFWDVAVAATRNSESRSQLEDRRVITVVAGGVERGGLFVGMWDDAGDLIMKQARIRNEDGSLDAGLFKWMGTCSVSSCEARPTVVYAGCAYRDGRFFRVLRSQDGGRSWTVMGTEVTNRWIDLTSYAGDQGALWNNCIAVSPTNPGLVALGWVALFLTLDGGKTWRFVEESPHLHADCHAVRFYPETAGAVHNLYVGSDGGVARINLDDYLNPPGKPFQSNYNCQLPILQCYSTLIRDFYGTFAPSRTVPWLIATGLQDNGNVYCQHGPTLTPWLPIEGGDGGWNAFLTDGALLHNWMGGPVSATTFNSAGGPVVTGVVAVTNPPGLPGLVGPFGEAVARPTYRNAARQLLQALAARQNQVFGLFVDDSDSPRYHWELLATLPAGEIAEGLASFHGGSVFVGTAGGKMYVVDTKQGSVLELPVALPKPAPSATVKGGDINRIVLFSESEAYALMNAAQATYKSVDPVTGAVKDKTITSYYVLRLDGLKWVVTGGAGLPNERLYGLEAVALPQSRVPHALFANTDDRVYVSRDAGANWQQAAQGLPRNPHCADLRFVSSEQGAALYLSTYGRSVWVAKLR
ncbi:MAG TPA: hypothetical protein VF546_02645 [Pyrinomonadaceae bacterium]|jgi:hypothetical protein